MDDWSEPIHRAAVWYVAAFGALSAVLVAGVGLANFDWRRAEHPTWAIMLAVLATMAAAWVGFAASRVLTPRWTSEALKSRQERLMRRPGDWRTIAQRDKKILRPLFTEDGFNGDDDSPRSLKAQWDKGSDSARERLESLVAAANRRASRRWFRVLSWTSPAALLVILGSALGWTTVSQPSPTVATISAPVAVQVRLAPDVNPTDVFGGGCESRERTGVAVDGGLDVSVLVALPATDDCQARLVLVRPETASVTRR